jgi:uncharacterized phiE125 gp8 family phage protein
MGTLITLTAAADFPVTLQAARSQCRLTDDDTTHDDLLLELIKTATNEVETVCNIALVERTVRYDMQGFAYRDLCLPVYPVKSITNIKYDDPDDAEQTVATADYWTYLEGMEPFARSIDYWPQTYANKPGSARVTFVAGYDSVEEIPADIKQAILVRVYDLWTNPGSIVVGTIASDSGLFPSLADKYRRYL